MEQKELSFDFLLQETLSLSEFMRASSNTVEIISSAEQASFFDNTDYLYDLADGLLVKELKAEKVLMTEKKDWLSYYPETAGIIYKIDNNKSTFCVRGFSSLNIRQSFEELIDSDSSNRALLKLNKEDNLDTLTFFSTDSFELAEAIRDQVINRRFPHQEDAVCNISDPGYSWWMNVESNRFEIFFRSHGINRAEKYIQLGPIGDPGVAALRMNQARSLLRSSFPISEFSCDDKSFTVASTKPDHSSFVSFRNIFLAGVNHTEIDNFPDNSLGRALFYYFHELAIVRKFWIEVKTKLC